MLSSNLNQINNDLNKISLILTDLGVERDCISGNVYIASMNMRGTWATCDNISIKKINVTSAQGKRSQLRLDFSPMTPFTHHFPNGVPDEYKDFYCFENYWQGGKIYENVDSHTSLKWWKSLKEPKRRLKVIKSMLLDSNKTWSNGKYKGKVLYGIYHSINNGQPLYYVESRKLVYVPKYYNIMVKTKSFKELKKYVESGKDIVVYDFDGPRDENGEPVCVKVDLDLLREKIDYTRHPFGHGYVVASALAGYTPEDYV